MYVSILLVRGVLSELRGRGFDEANVLEGTGVSPQTLEELTATISLAEWDRITTRALALTQDPALPLAIACHLPFSALQLVAHLLRAASSLRESINVFARYAELLGDELSWRLLESGTTGQLACQPRLDRGEPTRFCIELALGLALQFGRHLAPPSRARASVDFTYAAPAHVASYEWHLGCEVRFGQPRNAITFARELLDEPRLGIPDTLVTERVRDHAERLLSTRLARSTVERARAVLEHSPDLTHFEPDRLAAALGMGERVLRRRLAVEGTPLGELLSQVRFAMAREAMRSPDVPIKEVSERLGFSEPSAFHRAFKRWTGMTPSEYLKAQRAQSARGAQPGEDALADPSGVFKLHEVPHTQHALDDHA